MRSRPCLRPSSLPWRAGIVAAVVALGAAGCSGEGGPPRISLGESEVLQAADEMLSSMVAPVDFVLADGVNLEASEADAWRWDPVGLEGVGPLATRLGVEGEPVAIPEADGGGWQVGDPERTPYLSVTPNGSWWAASGGPSVSIATDCASDVVLPAGPDTPVSSSQGSSDAAPGVTVVEGVGRCVDVAPTPPPVLPTDAEVLASASAVFGEGATVEVEWRDEWSVLVQAEYLVDGAPSGQSAYYGVDGGGWNASGLLATPVREGPYPTISAADAVARLSGSPLGLGRIRTPEDDLLEAAVDFIDSVGLARGVVRGGVGLGVEGDVGEGVGAAPAVPDDVAVESPTELLPEPMPEPMPIEVPIDDDGAVATEVVLVAVAAKLVPFVDGDGAVWSLPGFVFSDADGGEWEVVAVSDEYFDDPVVDPGDGVVGSEPPLDGDTPVDGGVGGGTGDVVEPFPGSPSPPEVIGASEAEAVAILEGAGFTARVVERDGEPFMVTKDYREDRVNLVIAGGVVTGASIG